MVRGQINSDTEEEQLDIFCFTALTVTVMLLLVGLNI